MTWDWLLWALPFAALLACPVMMLWMMRGGGSGGKDETTSPASGVEGSGPSASHTEKEIDEPRNRLADLEADRDRDREESLAIGE